MKGFFCHPFLEAKTLETRQRNPVLWLVFAIVLAVGLMAIFAAAFMPYGISYGMMGVGMGWGAVFMIVPAVVLILVLLAALGVFSPSPTYVPPAYGPPISPAIEVLNTRYARGEISRDEYLRLRADLEGRTS